MKIDHAALFCVDLEAMKDFFICFFDARPNPMYKNPKTGLRTYFLQFTEGGSRLEIMSRPEVISTNHGMYDSGYNHVCISVGSAEQVDLITRRLHLACYSILSGPRTTGNGFYESRVCGPEGILIEITI